MLKNVSCAALCATQIFRSSIDMRDTVLRLPESRRIMRSMKLAQIRKAKGLTQIQMAERVGMTQPTISRAERGDDGITVGTYRACVGWLSASTTMSARNTCTNTRTKPHGLKTTATKATARWPSVLSVMRWVRLSAAHGKATGNGQRDPLFCVAHTPNHDS